MKEVLHVPLDEVPEGAELANDLVDDQGRTLMKKGAQLSADKLGALARRGVERVQILSEEELDDAALEVRRAEISERVEQRFANTGADAAMQQLKEVILAYRLEVLR